MRPGQFERAASSLNITPGRPESRTRLVQCATSSTQATVVLASAARFRMGRAGLEHACKSAYSGARCMHRLCTRRAHPTRIVNRLGVQAHLRHPKASPNRVVSDCDLTMNVAHRAPATTIPPLNCVQPDTPEPAPDEDGQAWNVTTASPLATVEGSTLAGRRGKPLGAYSMGRSNLLRLRAAQAPAS